MKNGVGKKIAYGTLTLAVIMLQLHILLGCCLLHHHHHSHHETERMAFSCGTAILESDGVDDEESFCVISFLPNSQKKIAETFLGVLIADMIPTWDSVLVYNACRNFERCPVFLNDSPLFLRYNSLLI